MATCKASRSSSFTVESRNDSGFTLATDGTAALSETGETEDGPAVIRSTSPKNTRSVCRPSSKTAKTGGSSNRGWGGFLSSIFRSTSPTSNSSISANAGTKNDRQVPSPIGDIGYFAHSTEDDDQCTESTSTELVPPLPPPRRAVSDAPLQASTGSTSGRKSSLRLLTANNSNMTRRHSMSDSNLCRMRVGSQMSASSIIKGVNYSSNNKSRNTVHMTQDVPTFNNTNKASTTNNPQQNQTRRSSLRQTDPTFRRAMSRSTSMPTLSRSITFNKSVGFATIPSIDELSGSMRRKLYTSDEEYSAISRQRDTEISILRARALSPFRDKEDNKKNQDIQESDDKEEGDSLACDWGLEHHLLSLPERHARANKIRKTIDAVLNEQDKQRNQAHERGVIYHAYDAIGISTISMKCSQEARIKGLERAQQVERECKITMMRRKSDSALEVNDKSGWSFDEDEDEDEDDYFCDVNIYHQQQVEADVSPSSSFRPKMGRKSKSMKTTSKTAKIRRRMSLNVGRN